MAGSGLRHEHIDRVLLLTIDRPAVLNAVDHALAQAIGSLLTAADEDPQIGAVCVTGAGDRAFCAGADLTAIASTGWVPPDGPGDTGFAGIVHHPTRKPLVAAVNGLALGGGVEILLACDLALASPHATFGLPEVRHGLIAGGGGCVRLPHQIPPRFAMYLMLTGDVIDADTALRWGLVDDVVDHRVLLERSLDLARRISGLPTQAVQAARELARAGSGWAATPALWSRNSELLDDSLHSPAARRAVASFGARGTRH